MTTNIRKYKHWPGNMDVDYIIFPKSCNLLYYYDNCSAKNLNTLELSLHLEDRKKYKYRMTYIERNLWNRK